jgi:hypothetical protein
MNRKDFFILCVSTMTGQAERLDLRPLHAAWELPEEAYGGEKNLAEAARAFGLYVTRGDGTVDVFDPTAGVFSQRKVEKPAWLEAWEEGRRNRVRIRVNTNANHVAAWWQAAEQKILEKDFPFEDRYPELRRLCWANDLMVVAVVSRDVAAGFKDWASYLPAWDQEPLLFEDLPADES